MAASCVMKQVQERHIAVDVVKCVWSPKMDLLAIANAQGQVSMHRLTCQKVWQINSPAENIKVTSLAWKPDSRVLAISYTSGDVVLVNIENSSEIHRISVKSEVTALSWDQHTPPASATQTDAKSTKQQKDPWAQYMSPLPPLSKTYSGNDAIGRERTGSWQETKLLQDPNILTLLTVATINGTIHLYAFGFFHCATVDIPKFIPGVGKILEATVSQDLHMVSVILEHTGTDGHKEVAQVSLETLVLAWRYLELCELAPKYEQIFSLMNYAFHTLTHIEEAWESILLEMDDKLADYAKTIPEGGVTADFLDLLVFGYSSADFDFFLTDKLTDKGLKKLRHSVELSYSNMQKLVVRNLQAVGQALVFLLSQIVGMARREDRFGMLGVDEPVVTSALREAGAFLLKAGEVQQVIEVSMRDFQAFLKWLSGVLLRVLADQVSPDLSHTTQQEQSHIINFLNDSLEETTVDVNGEKRTRFCLERVGQYLKDENLTVPFNRDHNPWLKFLSSHPELSDHPLIMPHHEKNSLKQEYQNLKRVLNEMIAHPARIISESIHVGPCVSIVKLPPYVSATASQISSPYQERMYSVIVQSHKQSVFYLSQWSTNPKQLTDAANGPGPAQHVMTAPFIFSGLDSSSSRLMDTSRCSTNRPMMSIIDAQFYTEETLSILLQDPDDTRATYFVQLWVRATAEELRPLALPEGHRVSETGIPQRDASMLLDATSHRRLEVGPSSALAVSGSRKVAVILSENRRRIRLYEMEVDEDDDEDEEDDTRHESIINASTNSDDANEIL